MSAIHGEASPIPPAVHTSMNSVAILTVGEKRRSSRVPPVCAAVMPSPALPPSPYCQEPVGLSRGTMMNTVRMKARSPNRARCAPSRTVGSSSQARMNRPERRFAGPLPASSGSPARASCQPRSAMAPPAMMRVSPMSSLTSTSGTSHRAQAFQRRSTKATDAHASIGTAKAISWNCAWAAP